MKGNGEADLLIAALEAMGYLVQKLEWDEASYREFLIGYETGEHPSCFESHMKPETLARAASLESGIGIALYPGRSGLPIS